MIRIQTDIFGILISLACAVHCVVLPVVFSLLPGTGIGFFHHTLIEIITIILAFAFGIHALIHGYRKHHRKILPFILFTPGIALLTIRMMLDHREEMMLLIPALLLIVAAHLINFSYGRSAKANVISGG